MTSDLQALFDKLAVGAKAEALADKPIITLGELIAKLEAQDPAAKLVVQYHEELLGFGDLESYRGYYSDLSIDPTSDAAGTVAKALEDLRNAVGSTFTGYKGGEYYMTNRTLVWVSYYSTCSGLGVTGVEAADGVVVITSADCEG